MAAKKFLDIVAGVLTQVAGLVVSTGAPDAGKIAALDDSGKWDVSLMPSGIGANVGTALASEAIAARDLVNVYDNGGVVTVRKADATSPSKFANGFAAAAIANAATGQIQFNGQITGMSGLTAGQYYLSDTTPGAATKTVPSTAGRIVQAVGNAVSATALNLEIDQPITLA